MSGIDTTIDCPACGEDDGIYIYDVGTYGDHPAESECSACGGQFRAMLIVSLVGVG